MTKKDIQEMLQEQINADILLYGHVSKITKIVIDGYGFCYWAKKRLLFTPLTRDTKEELTGDDKE